MEPIVRVCTRARRLSKAFSGLTAWMCLWLASAAADAQPTPPDAAGDAPATAPEEVPAAAAAAANAAMYDPPLTDKDKVKEWEKANGELGLKRALRLERLANPDRDVLTKSVQHYLYRMTIKEEEPNLHVIVQKLLESLNSPKLTTKEARNYINDEIVRIAPELLGQPPAVRLNVLILAASLVSDPESVPPRPYAGATSLFLTVLDDPDQLVVAKLWSVKGLGRICREGDIPITERDTIATHLVAALNAPDAAAALNWWYRLRIVEALGDTGLCYDLQRQPIVIDALIAVMSSRKENWMVRSAASRSVTQLPWLAADNVNVPLVAYQIGQLTREIAEERNAKVNAPYWPYCMLNMYLSFNPQTAEQKAKNWGLLHQVKRPGLGVHEPMVTAAYQALLPVVNSVMSSKAPRQTTADEIRQLDDWLKNNIPEDRKPTPSSKQVDQSQGRVEPMANSKQP